MHVIKQALLMMVFCALLQFWLPWWTVIFPCFLISFVTSRGGFGSFFAGFFAVGLLWLLYSVYIDWNTSGMLSQKVAMIFPGQSVWVLRTITLLAGGLTGAFASLSGYSLKLFR